MIGWHTGFAVIPPAPLLDLKLSLVLIRTLKV